jgi:excinuclease UvrABC ATPase subunit
MKALPQNLWKRDKVLHRLREHGNTIVVIEHNLDVIKTVD